ncbi:MAG: chromosome partitioning protein ParB [Marinovum sp.]|nr:chromosome partitioning protein ParB [Marinovum sp.]|tara:strand:+ start:6534 stop:7430 length:897 start_codon:yes stop_codon:yes gene_type:complete
MVERKGKSRGLGRGLSSLMGDINNDPISSSRNSENQTLEKLVPVEKIYPNPNQPRKTFQEEKLIELANSIKIKGVVQPLIVRKKQGTKESFEIVAGERRWRAAQRAQIHELPVIVREFSDTEVLEIAIIENVQRADLNPVEEALGYKNLMDNFNHTQEGLSKEIGKSRSHIANLLRLLNLPAEVQDFLISGKLTAGHARALVTCDNPLALAKQIISQGLSVRDAELLAKKAGLKEAKTKNKTNEKPADTISLESDLSAALKMKVSINHEEGKEKGLLSITYKTFDELDRICEKLLKST